MSDAKWKLMVDWQGDGEFAGADDDITPATLGLSLQHKRDLRSEYIDPARLDIRLANFDHKYSPPNTASPLFGSLKPGRKVWLRAAFPCDEFGDMAGTNLADHAPEYGAAYRWTDPNHDFRIAADGGAQTDGAHLGRRIATMDFGLADVSFGCDFTRGSNATRHGGLTLRYADADNFLYVRVMPNAVQLRRVEQGSDALVGESALQWNAGETREFLAESKDFDVVGGQLSPQASTDYAANTQLDGTGTDITEELTVTYPATRLYNGKGTLIRVRFGATAGYLTRLGMRTVNALTFNAPVLVTAEDTNSQLVYGQRIRSIDARWTR